MSRSYKSVRPKQHRVYSVDDLMSLYDVSRNTVTNWIKAGLKPSDERQPFVFRGAVVKAFHNDRRLRVKGTLESGEFQCLGCKMAVRPPTEAIKTQCLKNSTIMLWSHCQDCGAELRKLASKGDLALLTTRTIPNTIPLCRHEVDHSGPVGIGKSELNIGKTIHMQNDRVIFAWQIYAKRHSTATQDQHLAAIRFLENHLDGKPFARLEINDIDGLREHLRELLSADGDEALSRSTISHILSQLRDFLAWLLRQKEFASLPRDLLDYLKLSRSDYAAALPRPPRPYPTIEEAVRLLDSMPQSTPKDRRSRALFALAFLGALRADTLVSLRLAHINLDQRHIVQDATEVRAKNGKSLVVHWFPIPSVFGETLVAWVEELQGLGCLPNDALFPSDTWLRKPRLIGNSVRDPIAPMTTKHAATEAFRLASHTLERPYTPHAAKHTIAALRNLRSLTHEERKAWSENMGHDTEQITSAHYGKLTDSRRAEVFSEMGSGERMPGARLTPEERRALLDARATIDDLLDE